MSTRSGCFHLLAAAIAFTTLMAAPAAGQSPGPAPGVEYELAEASMFEAGCLPPCLCPVLNRAALQGTFRLVGVPVDGPFQLYRVLDVEWSFNSAGATARVSGSGTYRLNTPSQGFQQLVLDLAVDGGEPQRYDSGLVEGGDAFPAIRLPVALHGFFCHDSVYGVDANPRTGGVPPPDDRAELNAGPNPFARGTGIGFLLAAAGPVDLRIYDLAGREMRTLAERLPLPAGSHRIEWDGLNREGHEAPAGIYFARLRVSGGERRLTLVKRE